jgi:hypothetical protein
MAYTASLTGRSVFGDKAVAFYTVTADAASGTVVTGFGSVDGLTMVAASVTTNNSVAAGRVRANATAAGVAAAGTIGFSGFTNGDVLYLTVFGH